MPVFFSFFTVAHLILATVCLWASVAMTPAFAKPDAMIIQGMPKAPAQQVRGPMLPSPQPVLEADPTVVEPAVTTVTLPSGTPLSVWLLTPLDTRTAQAGQPIEAKTTQPIYVDTRLLLPEGLHVQGQVVTALPPVEGRNAILKIAFTQLTLADGTSLPLTTHVKTGTPEHYWGGELTPGTERKLVTHGVLGIGYYNQEVLTGKRAVGTHFRRPIGDPLTIILEAPLSVPAVLETTDR